MNKDILLSVVVPAYNEEEILELFLERTRNSLDPLNIEYEIIIINDGSSDGTESIIRRQAANSHGLIKGVMLRHNVGQHIAIVAGFTQCRGKYVLTIDADLQNPPEEIPNLLAKIEKGYDYVGSYRKKRQDSFFRKYASRIVNLFISFFFTGHKILDYGCMMRMFKREVTDGICNSHGEPDFIPVMAMKYTKKYKEIGIKHQARAGGQSQYSFSKLIVLFLCLLSACIRLKKKPNLNEPLATSYFEIQEVVS